ncbi:MAG: ATP-dependent DNA helicase RecG [Clostridiales bacterium]|nr:ATP-dependent DNA helicase RecG [Clostridiales bacterium]
MDDSTNIIDIKGVGEKTAKLFSKINIRNVGELLHNYPRDYETFKEPIMINDISAGEVCSIRACLVGNITTKKIRNLTIINFVVKDAGGQIAMTYFNMPYVKNMLKKGMFYIFRGIPQMRGGRFVMEQAKIYKPEDYFKLTGVLQPRYSLTAGLTNHMVTKAVKQALSNYRFGEDYLPEDIKEKQKLISYGQAIEDIHFPQDYDKMLAARKRLVFDEFFLFILALRKCKEKNEVLKNTYPMLEVADTKRLIESLPYALTGAQKKVWEEIKQDLQSDKVMNRLIQGDVGSGKTILAFLSLLMCVSNGYQGAMMAPTEVLARQHFESALELTAKYKLPFAPVLLIGSMSAKEKRAAYEEIQSGKANVVIGTHALIQEKVEYKKLALVVTDEQHRFGVRQRETLAGKGENVHVIVMSATPIPRTLAIILYGDLDISIVDELPANRLPIKNCVVSTDYREKAYRFIEKEVQAGRQVYVICPMVEEGELEGAENVISYTEKLKSVLSPQIQVSYLHGKMRSADKNHIMEEFANRNIDVLVSTTVIEVGINVPNATVIMVENAERFGLAQLHQLRGRVGRGDQQSYCIFISSSDKKQTMERLDILNHSNDGFFIAGEDLKLRGPGDLFGIRQSGLMDFKIGDIYQDAEVLKRAGESVDALLAVDEALEEASHLPLRRCLENTLNAVDFRTI